MGILCCKDRSDRLLINNTYIIKNDTYDLNKKSISNKTPCMYLIPNNQQDCIYQTNNQTILYNNRDYIEIFNKYMIDQYNINTIYVSDCSSNSTPNGSYKSEG